MNAAPPNAPPESPWPGPKLLGLIALILRATLGFALLSEGLAGYFLRPRMGMGMTQLGGLPMFYQQVVPVVQICLGLALILGFLTVIAAVAAGVLGLALSALVLFQAYIGMTTTGNPGAFFNGAPSFGGNPFLTGVAFSVGSNTTLLALHQVAVIVLGKPTINLYSVDALIFRREDDARPQGPPPRFVDGRREPEPDEHLIA